MREISSALFGVAIAVGACISGGAAASLVFKDEDAHRFANLETPDLWTSAPTRIDTAHQNLERLPPVLSAAYPIRTAPVIRQVPTPVALETKETVADTYSPDHVAWCHDRYQSYDETTNSYRSFSGSMRSCVSPYLSTTAASADEQPRVEAGTSHQAWCAQRYSSYRASDDTYQPYSGQRRQCVSPFSGDVVAAQDAL